ncbi:MAG: SDR family NAD(P)-dependent oxidoreductase, partial [Hyphomicrobiaceae bacterium]
RTTGALEEVDDAVRARGGSATLVNLDMRKPDRVDALGPSAFERWGKLDILVANAGVLGPLSPLAHVTNDAWADTMEINLNSNWRLIRTLDPLLRRSDAGRAIFVSSGAASAKNAYWGPYAVSKAGLEALVKTYAHEIAETSIRANIVNPGPIRTAMRAKAFPGEDPMTLASPEDIAPLFLELADPALTANGQVFNFKRPTAA